MAGLAVAASCGADVGTKGSKVPAAALSGGFIRYLDPTTETPVVRLTDLGFPSFFPSILNRFIAVDGRSLLLSTERGGRPSPFQLSLRAGTLTEIAQPKDFQVDSLCWGERDRFVYLLSADQLQEVSIPGHKVRVIAEGVSAFSPTPSQGEIVAVRRNRLEYLGGKSGPVLAEDAGSWCAVSPDGGGCLFSRRTSEEEQEFWHVSLSPAAGRKPTRLAAGRISNPVWSNRGRSVLFLRQVPGNSGYLPEIYEATPESGEERRVVGTSQFVAFAVNGNGSVFVGAARSKAQPTIVLMLRDLQREVTLCEHRASRPEQVKPSFSPDGRRVYFQSDREGKWALYSVNVEHLVEPTGRSSS